VTSPGRAILALFALALSGRGGEGAVADDFERLTTEAEEASQAKRFNDAIDRYGKALELKPEWLEGRFSLGSLLYQVDDYAGARTQFGRIVASDPTNALAFALRGLCEVQLSAYESALADLEKAHGLGMGNEQVAMVAGYQYATLLTRFERYDAAQDLLKEFALQGQEGLPLIEAFGLALLRLPYLPSEAPPARREMILLAGRAAYYMARGMRTDTARFAQEELRSRYPEDPNVRYAYGTFLLADEPDAALAEFERVLELSPGYYHARIQIALELMERGQPEDALPYARQAMEAAPTYFAARLVHGRALLETGDLTQAIPELERSVDLAPTARKGYLYLARAYQRAGRDADAERIRTEFAELEKQANPRQTDEP
jgi:tetratricopeptide (TPR) repeat protein